MENNIKWNQDFNIKIGEEDIIIDVNNIIIFHVMVKKLNKLDPDKILGLIEDAILDYIRELR